MDIITRQEAKAQGLKRYFTGKQCKHGHLSERFVGSKACCQCQQTPEAKAAGLKRKQTPEAKAQQAEYYKANAAQISAWRAEYNKANRVEIAAKKAAYAKRNRVEIAARTADYQKSNPHIYNAQKAKRRAQKLQATPPWVNLEAIKAIYKQCAERTKATGIKHAVDHIYPLTSTEVCGLHVAANLQILTKSENSSKSNRMPAPEQIPSDHE
jgi:5-methylcytosine-specific restriction endonuclease McrA